MVDRYIYCVAIEMFYFFILIVDIVTVCYNYSLNSLRADDINTVAYSYPRLLKIKYLFAKISLTGFERMLSICICYRPTIMRVC